MPPRLDFMRTCDFTLSRAEPGDFDVHTLTPSLSAVSSQPFDPDAVQIRCAANRTPVSPSTPYPMRLRIFFAGFACAGAVAAICAPLFADINPSISSPDYVALVMDNLVTDDCSLFSYLDTSSRYSACILL